MRIIWRSMIGGAIEGRTRHETDQNRHDRRHRHAWHPGRHRALGSRFRRAARRVHGAPCPPPFRWCRQMCATEESLRQGLRGQDGLYLNLSVAPGSRRDIRIPSGKASSTFSPPRASRIARIATYRLSSTIRRMPNGGCSTSGAARCPHQVSGNPPYDLLSTNFMETLAQRHERRPTVCCCLAVARSLTTRSRQRLRPAGGAKPSRWTRRKTANIHPGSRADDLRQAAVRYARTLSRSPLSSACLFWAARLGGLVLGRELKASTQHHAHGVGLPEVFKAARTWNELGRPTTTIEVRYAGEA